MAKNTYLEKGLPEFLEESIRQMEKAWEKIDNDISYTLWDADFCNLQSDINVAEVCELISSEQASYLRKKYSRYE